MAVLTVKKTRKDLLKTVIIIAIMLLVGFLPPFGEITKLGMQILGIFVGCVVGWCFGEMIWPSLLGLLLVGLTEYSTVGAMLAAAFGNTTLWLVAFCLMFLYAIDQCGLLDVTTKFILSRKFVTKGPWTLAAAFWIASGFISIFISVTNAVTLVIWSFFLGVCRQVGIKAYEKYPTLVLIGCCLLADLGTCIAPFSINALVCIGVYNGVMPGAPVNMTCYSLLVLCINIIFVPLFILLCKYVLCRNFHLDLSQVQVVKEGESLRLNGQQKIVIGYILLLVFMFVAPTFLPSGWALTKLLNSLSYAGILGIILVLMSITTYHGEPIMRIAEAMRKNVIWEMFFMLAAAWTLAAALVADSVGISATIKLGLTPFLAGKSAWVFCIICLFAGVCITNCINNAVTMTLLIPITMGFVAMNGINPCVLVSLFVVVLTQGAILPSGSPLGAMMHGYREWLRPKDIILYAGIFVFTLTAVAALIGYPLGCLIFAALG